MSLSIADEEAGKKIKRVCDDLHEILIKEDVMTGVAAITSILMVSALEHGISKEVFFTDLRYAWDHYSDMKVGGKADEPS